MSAADESSPSKSQYPEAETSSCEHVPPGERTVCEGLQVDVDKVGAVGGLLERVRVYMYTQI